MSRRLRLVAVLLFSTMALPTLAAGPTFRPDAVFSGSSLAGWTPLGAADWRAQSGEVVGTPRSADGGWLVLNKSYQDVGFFSNITCPAGCRTGLLFRMEKSAGGGFKGVFVSLADDDLASYAVSLDAQGHIERKQKLGPPPGMVFTQAGGTGTTGTAAPTAATPAAPPPQLPPGVSLPGLARPTGEYRHGQTNGVDVVLALQTLTVRFNGGSLAAAMGGPNAGPPSGTADEAFGKYGPVAIYAGGTAPVSFKNVAYADLNARPFDVERISPHFRLQRLSEFYYSYSTAVADVNRDGHMDVIAGPYYYLGPAFTVARQFFAGITYNPTSEYPLPAMVQLAYDWTGDGWPDILSIGGNAGNGVGTLYVNPHGELRRWDAFVVMQPPEHVVANEETLLKDIDGDGKPEIIHAGQNCLRYSKPDWSNPTASWITTTISEPGPWGTNASHGLGIGDINGDGLADFVTAYGWWEQPPRPAGQKLWTYHPAEFGRWGASQGGAGGAEMGIYDVNGDGLNDVVGSLEGHGFGLAWHEQKRDAKGTISFVRHVIMDSALDRNTGGVFFTQPHAVTFADIDLDGVPDMIVGKRQHSHFQYMDPDNWDMPVLYVYRTVRTPKAPGGALFVPELVHNRSGVGSHMTVADLNGDGTPDIATSGPSGTFLFFNRYTKTPR
jgi:hypothetical protein